jgi:O-antigen/teichoic acid export membrane protein
VIAGLVTLPLIVVHLGKFEYGIWVLVGQVISFLVMSDLGVANAVSRFVARFRGENDLEAINRLLSTVIALMLAMGTMVALLTVALTPWIPGLLGIKDAYAGTTRTVFVISGLSLAFQFPIRIGMGILAGYQLYGPHAVGKILEAVLQMVSVPVLAVLDMLDVVTLSITYAVIRFGAYAVSFVLAKWMTGPWSLGIRKISPKMAKDVIDLGGSVLVVTLSNLAYTQGMVIALCQMAGLGAVAVYGVILTLIGNMQSLITAVGGAMPTLASEWHARGELSSLRRIVNFTMRVTFAISLSAAAGLFIYGEPTLRVLFHQAADWTNLDFQQARWAMIVMSLGLAVGLPQTVSRATLQATGKHWKVTYSVAGAGFASLVAGLLALSLGWGVLGAALSWTLAMVIEGILLFPPMICRHLDQSIREMLIDAYLPGAGVGLLVLISSIGISFILRPSDVANLLSGVGSVAVIGGIAIVLISGQGGKILRRLGLRGL